MKSTGASLGRIAVVHEWISARAGSEQVFEAIAQTYPSADLFALTRETSVDLNIGPRRIQTSFLDNSIFRDRRQLSLPLMPSAMRHLPGKRSYDTVITSHHAFASSNRLSGEDGNHFVYVHSPARYVWSPEVDGRGGSRLARAVLRPARTLLKHADLRAVAGIHSLAVNSLEVGARVERYWNRESVVIHPPVDVDRFSGVRESGPVERSYLLGFGRWIGYKNLHKVIEVAEKLDIPAVIAGSGPNELMLRERARAASVPVSVVVRPSDTEVGRLYRGALALVFPTFEDFGIVPVEAQASGTPVAALAKGGALETVVDGVSGAFAQNLDTIELARSVERAIGCDAEDCRNNARRFDPAAFRRRLMSWVEQSGVA